MTRHARTSARARSTLPLPPAWLALAGGTCAEREAGVVLGAVDLEPHGDAGAAGDAPAIGECGDEVQSPVAAHSGLGSWSVWGSNPGPLSSASTRIMSGCACAL